jgi:hypothetical protein
MTYRWLTDLDQALTAGGVPFTEVPATSIDPTGAASWHTRGRPTSTGQFDPTGVLCHHTASPAGTSDQSDLNVILRGNAEAPGPISSLYVGRSGVVYLIAAGRANHGGGGRRPGIDTGGCADMNAALLGIEAGNSGVGERWGDAQTNIYGALVAALCSWYGWAVDTDVYLHATTGPPSGGCNSKIDPSGPWQVQPDLPGSATWSLDLWRQFVAAVAIGPGPHPPIPPPSEEHVSKCIIHVDGTKAPTDPGYFTHNAVWNWFGAWRFHLPSELAVQQAVYENTGDANVWSAVMGDIIRNPAWVQPVGALDGYGAVAGHDPGDV